VVLDRRIARAGQLAIERRPSAEVLTFFAAVAVWQRDLLLHAARRLPATGDGFVAAATPDMALVAGLVPPFVDAVRASAPRRVDETLAPLARLTAGDWQRLCTELWRDPGALVSELAAAEAFVAEAVLQPFAELRTAGAEGEVVAGADASRCPRCGGRALAATLRERGHGAGRALVCGFCAAEWTVPRVVCPACGQTRVETLPVYRDGDLPALRLDACDTCRVYVKAIDLTVDGRLDPVVDDLATLALDLWATAEGYRRLRPNLLRV
jgi:formate dehydrogenase accessory protein FdhE